MSGGVNISESPTEERGGVSGCPPKGSSARVKELPASLAWLDIGAPKSGAGKGGRCDVERETPAAGLNFDGVADGVEAS